MLSGLITGFHRIPLTVRVPASVALLMVALSASVSERALARFDAAQSRHLVDLGEAYLDGLGSALFPYVLRRDVWEVYDVLDRARDQYRGLDVVQTAVLDADGRVIAATDPVLLPSGSGIGAQFGEPVTIETPQIQRADDRGLAFLHRDLMHQGHVIGTIHARVDISALQIERQRVFLTLVLTNIAITVFLSLLGFFAVRQMVQPLRDLSHRLSSGRVEKYSEAAIPPDPETGRIFRAYNRLVDAIEEREALSRRMAEKERLVSLGQLTSGLAHEINNPLGGLQMAVETLRRHGGDAGVRARMTNLLDRGLGGIAAVVRSTRATYRPDEPDRPLTPDDFEDLRLLIGPELRQRGLVLSWRATLDRPVAVQYAPLRQIVLNLLLNACAASPPGSIIALSVKCADAAVIVTVEDSGNGLPETQSEYLTTAATEAPPVRSGPHLGLWLVRSLANDLNATITVGRSMLGGAEITLSVPLPDANQARGFERVA